MLTILAEMYSIHNEKKLVFPERFIRTLNSKIYKYYLQIFYSVLKDVYIEKLDDVLTNTTIHMMAQLK